MSSTVKSLKVSYEPLNANNTFTNGDWVSGQVTLEVAKDCKIESLSVKFKGKARVMWSEHYGKSTVVYYSKDKFFSFKHYFVRDAKHAGERSSSWNGWIGSRRGRCRNTKQQSKQANSEVCRMFTLGILHGQSSCNKCTEVPFNGLSANLKLFNSTMSSIHFSRKVSVNNCFGS